MGRGDAAEDAELPALRSETYAAEPEVAAAWDLRGLTSALRRDLQRWRWLSAVDVLALALVRAEERGFADGLSRSEIEEIFARIDPALYGAQERRDVTSLISNTRKQPRGDLYLYTQDGSRKTGGRSEPRLKATEATKRLVEDMATKRPRSQRGLRERLLRAVDPAHHALNERYHEERRLRARAAREAAKRGR